MARETKEQIDKRLPSDLIQLVLDMYDGRKKTKEIVAAVKAIFPEHKFSHHDIPRILKAYRGETLTEKDVGGKTFMIRFDKDVSAFLESLPISPSDFCNAIMGIYIREYKYKKSKESNE